MSGLFRKKENSLHPLAEKLAGTLAGRLLQLQQRCAAWLDRMINPRPLYQKKAILTGLVAAAGCWCLYLIISGLIC